MGTHKQGVGFSFIGLQRANSQSLLRSTLAGQYVNSEDSPRGSISSLGGLEGPGSGFESLSGGAGAGIWKSGNLEIKEFCPFWIEVEKQGFRTPWDITGPKFLGVGLKLEAFIPTCQDQSCHLCQEIMRVVEGGDLKWESCSQIWDYKKSFCWNHSNPK